MTEGDKVYLYTGFCAIGDRSRSGMIGTVLKEDMLTIEEDPIIMMPSEPYSKGSGYEGHEFFEAPSIRKRDDTYYLIYSSIVMHELCYATSKNPRNGFSYGGVIISNNDMHIDSYKPADKLCTMEGTTMEVSWKSKENGLFSIIVIQKELISADKGVWSRFILPRMA